MNDAFIGGTHCQDVRTIMPVFRNGELIAFVQNSAHWSDAGGPVPGSFHAEAASTYGEALYIPPIHLVREGELDDEVMRFILRNVRVPDTTQGDVFAQIASCRTGEARLQSLIDKYGLDADQVRDGRADPLLGGAAARGVPQAARRHLQLRGRDRLRPDRRPRDARQDQGLDHDRRRPGALRPLRQRSRGAGRDQLDALDGAVGAGRRDEGDLPARARQRGHLQRDRHDQSRGAGHERAVPAADQRRLRDLVRGHHRVHLRLLPAGRARALDGLLGEHDEHGRGRVRRPRRATTATS